MSVHILFGDLSNAGDPRQYMTRKLQRFFEATGASAEQLAQLANRTYVQTAGALPLVEERELPRLDAGQQRFFEKEIALFKELVDRVSPLLDGERLLPDSDRCTLLKAAHGEYRAGTPVLVRRTNLATLYYIYNLAQVGADGRFSYVPDAPQPVVAAGRNAADLQRARTLRLGALPWADLLLQVAKGVAGAIGGKIGGELLNAMFPGSQGIDYKQMLDDFSHVVADANKNQTISEQGGIVNGVLKNNAEYYIPRKRGGAGKEELYGLLLTHHNALCNVIATLQYKDSKIDYTKAGLPVCVLSIDAHLATYQEMALEDPLAKDPLSSSNVEPIRATAPDYAKYAVDTANQIITDAVTARLAQVSEVLNNPDCDVVGSGVVCKSRYFFTDSATGYRSRYYEQSGCKDDPQRRCADARAAYVEDVRSAVKQGETALLQWVFDTAEQWKKLPENPLPTRTTLRSA